jgi:hypothetical protein
MNIIFLEQNTKNVSEGSLASVCSSKTVDILKLCTVVLISHVQATTQVSLTTAWMSLDRYLASCLNIQLLATDSNNLGISGLVPNL